MTDTTPRPQPSELRQDGDRIALSLQQEFLRAMDHGDGNGPFGPYYHIVGGWRLHGPLDLRILRGALNDVVARHEGLRTAIVLDETGVYQRVRPPAAPELVVRDLPADGDRERIAEQFACDIEAGPFGTDEYPSMRMVLGRFDRQDAVLVMVAHHTMVDGWSAQVVMRDLAEHYAARAQRRRPVLPPARQPREYTAWQRAEAERPATAAARAFWRTSLHGARMLTIPTDRPRPAEGDFRTGWHRFLLGEEFGRATATVAARTRSSSFMVLLAAYLMHLRDRTGQTDLVLPTFTPGRSPGWTEDVVGSFYNFLPLRVDVEGCADLLAVVARVRSACLAAYVHEIPFVQLSEEAPELMSPLSEPDGAASVFQVVQSPFMMTDWQAGDLRFTAMRRRLLSASVGSQLPDGLLWSLEPRPGGLILGKIGYTTNLFDEESVVRMAEEFRVVLRDTVVTLADTLVDPVS
ncbi:MULTISPECIES: condensation domain-containing protein [Actinoalloteichus]|uniref:Polyketide synthase component n=1 Tax=Actinoalloteichus fjordicus TaxID=1612552 RepID=A0AAC9LCP9_9PSEU|nr:MULTISPECIES: condensation domain-containing protein [Actinoalloteichus]APU15543.1 putative polyketide synthase component [Actinoalloteichus fjordicus]APU21610.1 putative polyketide synthase component [Actinoalloteichus sp. GBA129-24]